MAACYVALGSNLGDRERNLARGVAGLLRRGLPPLRISSVWETEPVDAPGSDWFLNLVLSLETGRAPEDLLDTLLAVEREVGRVRGARNAPRTLDLDLLLAGGERRDGPRLVLPHPRMWERRFVLAPLAELAPELRDPATRRTVLEILRSLPERPAVLRRGPLAAAGV